MYTRTLAIAALGGLIVLPACTAGNSAFEPPRTIAPLTSNKLQFQVGTANLNGTLGLNTVVTYRADTGLSALLDSTPVITLPFTNTGATGSNTDAGTNHISGSPQPANGVAAVPTTFGTAVGAFAYGFLGVNSATTGANNSLFYGPTSNPGQFGSPYYAPAAGTVAQRPFYIGPGNPFLPTLPPTGTNYVGAPSGFTTFYMAPTTGTYSLSVGLSGTSTPVPTYTATTTMTTITPLGLMGTPVYVSDGAGGGTVTVTIPPGVTETGIFITDRTQLTYYTLFIRGTGVQTATLPAGSIPATDTLRIIAVGFDYPAFEAAPIGANPPAAPLINNTGTPCTFNATNSTCTGQADLTESNAAAATE